MGFALGDLLENPEEGDSRVEEAGRVGRYRSFR